MVKIIEKLREVYSVYDHYKEQKRINQSNLKSMIIYKNQIIDKTNGADHLAVLLNILRRMGRKGQMEVTPACVSCLMKFKRSRFNLDVNVTPYQLTKEFSRRYITQLLKIYKSITDEGYLPEKYGHIIVWKKGNKFKLRIGHRRVAVLMFLGFDRFKVKVVK